MDFKKKLSRCMPKQGELALFWLGQAGFLVKNSSGEVLAVDPYLSDAVERICGLKRLMMPVLEPEDLNPQWVLVTHHDEDHLDMDILPDLMRRNPKSRLLAPETSCRICLKAGMNQDQIYQFSRGESLEIGSYRAEAVFADHGDHAPDAIGILLETEGHRIYFSGDTSFQCERMRYAASKEIDILILPINGEYGNMNSYEGVELVQLVKPKLTIPSHFWTFIRHGSDPYTFDREMRLEAPGLPFYFMCQGEMILWNGQLV